MNPMESPKPLQFGGFLIPKPCEVQWAAMQELDGRNRHCQRCNHAVYDLTGMSISEIDSLFKANDGKLCGNFSIDELGNPIYFKGSNSPRKPVYLKHLAAAASMFFLYQTPQATSSSSTLGSQPNTKAFHNELLLEEGGIVPTEATNTLVTGVVFTQFGDEINDSLKVEIIYGGKSIASAFTSNGLFHFDLQDKLKPEDEIRVEVAGARFDQGIRYRDRKYGSIRQQVKLGKSQNLNLTVNFTAPEPMPRKLGGAVRNL